MLALIYVRVSTEEQAKRGFSLPEQLAECRKKAEELGATEKVEIVDDAGGDYLERPKLEQARQLVRTGGVKWFICFDPDRFSRNLLNQLLVTDEIDKAGVDLLFVQHQREKTPEGALFYAIRGAIAEFEKKKILERTQRGKRGKAKQGLLPGYVDPYGYTMDQETDRLVVNEGEAVWVRKMYEWASDPDPDERIGQWRIAERLNAMGIPAPRGKYWYRSTVAGILRNPLYTGVLHWGKHDHSAVYQSRRVKGGKAARPVPRPEEQWIALPVPPLVNPEVFARVHEFIQLDKNRRSRGNTYMLTGIALCGRCGGHIQSKTTTYRYLVCSNRYPQYRDMSEGRRLTTSPCDLPHLKAETVEEHVWQVVCSWMQDPNALRNVLDEDGQGAASPVHQLEQELAFIDKELQEAENAQGRVLALVARANVKPEVAEQQLRELVGRVNALSVSRDQVQQKLSLLTRKVSSVSEVLETARNISNEVGDRLDQLSNDKKMHLVRRLVARVLIRGSRPENWRVVPIRF